MQTTRIYATDSSGDPKEESKNMILGIIGEFVGHISNGTTFHRIEMNLFANDEDDKEDESSIYQSIEDNIANIESNLQPEIINSNWLIENMKFGERDIYLANMIALGIEGKIIPNNLSTITRNQANQIYRTFMPQFVSISDINCIMSSPLYSILTNVMLVVKSIGSVYPFRMEKSIDVVFSDIFTYMLAKYDVTCNLEVHPYDKFYFENTFIESLNVDIANKMLEDMQIPFRFCMDPNAPKSLSENNKFKYMKIKDISEYNSIRIDLQMYASISRLNKFIEDIINRDETLYYKSIYWYDVLFTIQNIMIRSLSLIDTFEMFYLFNVSLSKDMSDIINPINDLLDSIDTDPLPISFRIKYVIANKGFKFKLKEEI